MTDGTVVLMGTVTLMDIVTLMGTVGTVGTDGMGTVTQCRGRQRFGTSHYQ